MPELDPTQLDRLVDSVLSSPKYGRIAPEYVHSVARRELSNRRSLKEAIKATKNKLHQVAGAYLEGEQHWETWLEQLKQAAAKDDHHALRATCREVMRRHASTRERLPILDRFYAETLAGLPPIHSVLDIACGLNPLAIPWMGLPLGASYTAVDIYTDMMDFLGGFIPLTGMEGHTFAADVIESLPTGPVDLALVLKTIPCLEQVDRLAAIRLLDSIQASCLVVSFPVYSLGGRQKGMAANYERRFEELTAGKPWSVQRFEFPTELAFLIQK